MNKDRENIYIKAIKYFRRNKQLHMAIEEMAELTNALMKYERGRARDEEITEEIADVFIMLEQLTLMYSSKEDVDNIINQKLLRLDKYIKELEFKEKEP